VLEEAGFANIAKWLPFEIDEEELADLTANKMVRPTTIPQTLYHLVLEQALAREALRLSFVHHRELAKKVEKEEVGVFRRGGDAGLSRSSGREVINMMQLGMLIGSGGALSHAPRRQQAALMMLDSFQPVGVTRLAVDSIFMMPHLGVLSTVHPDIAGFVFEKDCLVPLGTSIAPAGPVKEGAPMAEIRLEGPGLHLKGTVIGGALSIMPLPPGTEADCLVRPGRNHDAGAGKGREVQARVKGGLVGLVLDGRGRPLAIPAKPQDRMAKVSAWTSSIGAFTESELHRLKLHASPTGAFGGVKKRD